jgi:hypothetical protein
MEVLLRPSRSASSSLLSSFAGATNRTLRGDFALLLLFGVWRRGGLASSSWNAVSPLGEKELVDNRECREAEEGFIVECVRVRSCVCVSYAWVGRKAEGYDVGASICSPRPRESV